MSGLWGYGILKHPFIKTSKENEYRSEANKCWTLGSALWTHKKGNETKIICKSLKLLNNIKNEDYYLKNFIAKALGFIAAIEFPKCYEGFIKILLSTLENSATTESTTDTILRILIQVLTECSDACAVITADVLPIILSVFKKSKNNQKNREKCLIIISLLLNKLSYADGNDMDLLSRSLDNNSLMENSISLFTKRNLYTVSNFIDFSDLSPILIEKLSITYLSE